MKKTFIWLVVICILVSMIMFVGIGCKTTAAAETTAAGTTAAAETTAAGTTGAEEKIVLNMWWWGETEKPGVKNWIDETINLYEKSHPNIKIQAVLQNLDTVQTAFRTAGAAKDPTVGPDIQFFWPGTYMMPDVWNGLYRTSR